MPFCYGVCRCRRITPEEMMLRERSALRAMLRHMPRYDMLRVAAFDTMMLMRLPLRASCRRYPPCHADLPSFLFRVMPITLMSRYAMPICRLFDFTRRHYAAFMMLPRRHQMPLTPFTPRRYAAFISLPSPRRLRLRSLLLMLLHCRCAHTKRRCGWRSVMLFSAQQLSRAMSGAAGMIRYR